MQLIIVESPHKAKTIEKFLKGDYKVDASKGHIRDLPVNYMGVSISKNFEPHYVISPEKKQDIKRLEMAAKKAEKVYRELSFGIEINVEELFEGFRLKEEKVMLQGIIDQLLHWPILLLLPGNKLDWNPLDSIRLLQQPVFRHIQGMLSLLLQYIQYLF